MTTAPLPDHYETLQVSSRADRDTIERVFRHLAKRYHPDNTESGDAAHFTALLEAFRVLSDPEARARYDVHHERARHERWRVFGEQHAAGDPTDDRRMHGALLSVLYKARRHNVNQPGLGIIDLEHVLGCPEEHMAFHLWYLKERGYVQRLDTGRFAITAAGVDHVMESGGPARDGLQLLRSGDDEGAVRVAAGS